MKRIFTILAAVLFTASLFAQAPQKMSYQSVVRDASDNLVINQTVGMQISILQGSLSGTVVYSEMQTPTTNDNGLLSIEFGGGVGFDTINWPNNSYFIKTEMDPTGGSTFTITGTSQLLSVPYALHAESASTISTPSIFSTSSATNVGSAFVFMDTIQVKANKLVTIKGYKKSSGSDFRVMVYYDGANLPGITSIYTNFDGTSGYDNTTEGGVNYDTIDKTFEYYYMPNEDMELVIRAKELTANSNGTGECFVIVIQ